MSDAWENLDPDDLEAEMERQEAYELSPAGIAEQNRYLLQRQQEFRLAADAVTAAWSERGEVEAVALFGSVAVALWKEVPRFRTYRRAGIALRHECKGPGPVAIEHQRARRPAEGEDPGLGRDVQGDRDRRGVPSGGCLRAGTGHGQLSRSVVRLRPLSQAQTGTCLSVTLRLGRHMFLVRS